MARRPGTPEQQAKDRATYQKRVAKYRQTVYQSARARGLSREEATRRAETAKARAGAARRGGAVPAYLAGQDHVVEAHVSFAQAKRVGEYDNNVRQLAAGRTSAAEFDQKWSKRAPLTVQGGTYYDDNGNLVELPPGKYKFADAATARYQLEAERALPNDERPYFDIQGY